MIDDLVVDFGGILDAKLGEEFDGWGLKILPPEKAKGLGELTETPTPTGHSQSIYLL